MQQADITVGDPADRGEIGKFDFQQWERGTIIAGQIDKFTGKAKLPGTSGDFKGTLTVQGTATSLTTDDTLGKLTIGGRMLDALIEVLVGNLDKATLGTMENSAIRVGVHDSVALDELPNDAGDFVAAAGSLGKLSFKGVKSAPKTVPSFINSIVAAFTIGTASFKVVQTDNSANGNAAHGLAATLIAKLSGTNEDGIKFPKLEQTERPAGRDGPAPGVRPARFPLAAGRMSAWTNRRLGGARDVAQLPQLAGCNGPGGSVRAGFTRKFSLHPFAF